MCRAPHAEYFEHLVAQPQKGRCRAVAVAPLEIDFHNTRHASGIRLQHDDTVGEEGRLIDVVRDEENGARPR
jgi:hypothetical protein